MTESPRAVSFNLIEDPWIPVQNLDGTLAEVGISELFTKAHQIRRMSNEVPTLDFAILRVLLAVVRQAVGPVEDPLISWGALWRNSAFTDETIYSYLASDEVHRRFNLIDDVAPFMQAPTLETSKNIYDKPSRLIPDIPAGHQHFTTRAGDATRTLSFPETARWLIHLQAYDYSGIKPGALGDERVSNGKGFPIGTGWAGNLGGFYLEGENLFETLMLNLRLPELGTTEDQDVAAWERSTSTSIPARGELRSLQSPDPDIPPEPLGDSDIFTWQSRRVRLRHDGHQVTGVLVTNGDRLLPQNSHVFEPLSLWRDSAAQAKKLGHPVFMPREHNPARAAWRGLSAVLGNPTTSPSETGARHETPKVLRQVEQLIFGQTIADSYVFSLNLVGFSYGPQNSSFDAQYVDSLNFIASLLSEHAEGHRQEALAAATRTDFAIRDLGDLAKDILIAGGNDRPPEQVQVLTAAYFDFDREFRTWLGKVSAHDDTDAIRDQWNQNARLLLTNHADRLMRQASQRSLLGIKSKEETWFTAHTARSRFNARLNKLFPNSSAPL
ncbi:type I-E CRISPR-associated protein Cse1/CasA [Glutamicibacter sp. NPDC087344]|uniref:type I-E CRISPR-associated protein Cse1/CasA n=1 Tax=Glutamicibacter sp. NPDC087344 TaxID=3363994 RepID=UPI00382C910C